MRFNFFAPTDTQLVRGALADDPTAFETLVLRYQRKGFTIARALGVPPHLLDDVIQESFLRSLRELKSLRDPSSFGPWFLAIVRNAARKAHREAQPVPAPAPPKPAGDSPPDVLEGKDFREYLWRKVAELPESIREAVFLYYHEGESTGEVAKTLCITRAAVKNRLLKGRDFLRERLWREMEECLRDMLPSTREWKRTGRRLTFLVMTSVPASWAGAAKAAGAAAVPVSGLAGPPAAAGAGSTKLSTAILGGLFMSGKKIALTLSIGLLLVLGGISLLRDPRAGYRGAGERPGSELVDTTGRSGAAVVGKDNGRSAAPGGEGAPEAPGAAGGGGPPSLAGRVIDESGSPLEGARVFAVHLRTFAAMAAEMPADDLSTRGPAESFRALREAYLRKAETVPRTSSAADGSYRFPELPSGDYRVLAHLPGYIQGAERRAVVRSGATARLDVELAEGSAISGKVVDENGQPVAGAEVHGEPSDLAALKGTDRMDRLALGWEEGKVLLEGLPARTDQSGGFRLVSLDPVLHTLRANKVGYLEAHAENVPAGAGEVVLVLSRGSSVTGRILDASRKPIAGAAVTLRPARSTEVHKLFDPHQADADLEGKSTRRTDTLADGRFSIEGLEEGAHDLSVIAEGHPPLVKEVPVPAGAVDLGDLVLETPRSIAGTVLGPGGAPVAGARVWVPRASRHIATSEKVTPEMLEVLAEARSDSQGRFSMVGLPAGPFTVEASARDLEDGQVRDVRGDSRDLVITLKAGIAIWGQVVDVGDSSPVAGAEVKIGPNGEKTALSDGQGRFEVRGVSHRSAPEGLTVVRARHPDFEAYWSESSIEDRDQRSPLVIRLTHPLKLSGRVVDPEGGPVAGAWIWLEDAVKSRFGSGEDAVQKRRSFSDEDGSFSLSSPRQEFEEEPRSFWLIAFHPAVGSARLGPLTAPPGGRPWPEVEIALAEGGVVSGRVMNGSMQPVPGAVVQAERIEETAGGPRTRVSPIKLSARTGRDGKFRLHSLEPGPSRITASALGYAPRRIDGVDVRAATVLEDIVLDVGGSIEGRVVDAAGSPLEGAEVVAFEERAGEGAGEEALEFSRRMKRLRGVGAAAARSGRDGRYALERLPDGRFSIVARSEGYEAAEVASLRPGDPAPDLVLARFAAIAGVVLDAETRQPIPRFKINPINKGKLRPDIPMENIGSEGLLIFSDPSGRFYYDGLRPGGYRLYFDAADHAGDRRELSLELGEELNLEVLLQPGERIEGVVRDAETGEPVPGASVHCWGKVAQGRPAPLGTSSRILSAEDGSFSISGLPSGAYSLSASHTHYLKGTPMDIDVPPAGPARFEIGLQPGGILEGRMLVVFEEERSVHPEIHLRKVDPGRKAEGPKEEPDDSFQSVSMNDDRYRVEHLEPGTYRVEIKKVKIEKSEMFQVGPNAVGGVSMSRPDPSAPVTDLGEVEILPRRTTWFDIKLP